MDSATNIDLAKSLGVELSKDGGTGTTQTLASNLMVLGAGLVVVVFIPLRVFINQLGFGEAAQTLELFYFAIFGSILASVYFKSQGTALPLQYRYIAAVMWISLVISALSIQGGAIDVGMHLLLLVPLVEELFFRGFLFKLLHKSLGWMTGALITSILFALLHSYTDIGFMASMMVLSLICCGLMRFKNGLILAVVAHSIWNMFAGAKGLEMSDGIGSGDAIIAFYLTFAISAVTLWVIRHRHDRQFQ